MSLQKLLWFLRYTFGDQGLRFLFEEIDDNFHF
jgi:hypothetical protein